MRGPTVVRLALLLHAAGWALVLALPGSTFALSQSLSGMAAVMDEESWAAVFGAVCITMALAGWKPGRTRPCVTAAVGFGHLCMAITFARSSHMLSPGTTTQIVFVWLSYWLFGEDLRDARRHTP